MSTANSSPESAKSRILKSRILSPVWQARLCWYLTTSAADLSGIRSSQAGMEAQLELRMNLKHLSTDYLSGQQECHPTPSWTDHDAAHDQMLKRAEQVALERQIGAAWRACTLVEQGRLFLAYVARDAMRPQLLEPLLEARRVFGPWKLLADHTEAAAAALAREQARAHRRKDGKPLALSAFLDRLSSARDHLTPEQWVEVHRIARGCEDLASAASEAFMRGLALTPRARRAA